ncbi:MAG TPA: glycoside hydrolase family 31 protein [Flavilitoribacter sp.]|nr:glycoside hydrolase family 31 protein [Flavilitoribacter sp.]
MTNANFKTISSRLFLPAVLLFSNLLCAQIPVSSGDPNQALMNEPVDISGDFRNFSNTYYLADSLGKFDPNTGKGEIVYSRYEYVTRMAFDNILAGLQSVPANEFPGIEYAASPSLPFSVEFVSPKTIRIRASTGTEVGPDQPSMMLATGTAPQDKSSWKYSKTPDGHRYTSPFGSVTITQNPWHIEIRDAAGKLLTSTNHNRDNAGKTFTPVLPFSFVRRAADYSRSISAAWSLSPDEKIFGCGESFTNFNKRGSKVVLWTDDSNGVMNETMYKPIPFFMSSRGYGMFMHTSSPITCDFGKYIASVMSLMIGDEALDLFIFLGDPKDILDEYTNLTGKSPMPPLWSFGFWMSRITYFSETDGRKVAADLRRYKIPADVIHFDTGWFETDWRCDYEFAASRFDDPAKMISDLKDQGFHISLWQLPYFVPKNRLFPEILEKKLYVRNNKGNLPYEDAVLDFSNPATLDWYREKIGNLLRLGVGAIKVDFGEAAPANGLFASGRTGFYEHNLYPLRYNKVVSDLTQEIHGERIIWARSAWAGSQRYPLHWGGDAANTDNAMAASLRGGLSFGLSGFSFWSHDIGGFVQKTPESLYRRWAPFGLLLSHSRAHGAPPKEPWEYSPEFLELFREADNLRYRLMPYIYAQAKDCTERGLPMVRALFVEYPKDPGSWLVDNEYLLGSDLLVAPLFEEAESRQVYLPPGQWIDYQSHMTYSGGWHEIRAGKIPIVLLVRSGAVIPHIQLAQTTKDMDWSRLELMVFGNADKASGLVYLPGGEKVQTVSAVKRKGKYQVEGDPFGGKVRLEVRAAE